MIKKYLLFGFILIMALSGCAKTLEPAAPKPTTMQEPKDEQSTASLTPPEEAQQTPPLEQEQAKDKMLYTFTTGNYKNYSQAGKMQGLLDEKGNVVFDMVYARAEYDQEEGYAILSKYFTSGKGEPTEKFALGSRDGEVLTPFVYGYIGLRDGLFIAQKTDQETAGFEGGKSVLVNAETLEQLLSFNATEAYFVQTDDTVGVYHNDDKTLVLYDIDQLKQGHVEALNTISYIQMVYAYDDNVYVGQREGTNKAVVMDTRGNVLLPERYDGVSAEAFGDAQVRIATNENKMGLIDSEGEIVAPFKYDSIFTDNSPDVLIAWLNGKCGAINLEGDEIVPMIYANVRALENSSFVAWSFDDNTVFLDQTGKIMAEGRYNINYFFEYGARYAAAERLPAQDKTEGANTLDKTQTGDTKQNKWAVLNLQGQEIPLEIEIGVNSNVRVLDRDKLMIDYYTQDDPYQYQSGLYDIENKSWIIPIGKYTAIISGYGAEKPRYIGMRNISENAGVLDIIDAEGNVLVAGLTEVLYCFSDVAIVQKGFESGMMNMQGEWLYKTTIFQNMED